MRRGAAFAALLLVAACTAQRPQPTPIAEFLAFGDSGYHYDYLDADEGEGVTTLEAFVEKERLDWLDDKRPPAEFKPPPPWRRPDTGTWVAASGQDAVATAMRRYCAGPAACEFAVMLGDNIYPDGATAGADGRDDATRFRKVLYEPYAPLAENAPAFRIYVALGNHDWRTSREGAMAQVKYAEETRPFYMDGIRYRVAPTGNPRELEIFVLDTHVLLSGVTVLEDELADDGSELHTEEIEAPPTWSRPSNDAERAMAEWLEKSLAESPGALEDRDGPPPDLVLRGQQVPAGAGAARVDPAGAVPPCGPLPRRPRAHARAAHGRLQGRAGGQWPPTAAASRLGRGRQAAPAQYRLPAPPARGESGAARASGRKASSGASRM